MYLQIRIALAEGRVGPSIVIVSELLKGKSLSNICKFVVASSSDMRLPAACATTLAVALLGCEHRCPRAPTCSLSSVAEQLDEMPVFGILVDDGTLYGDADSGGTGIVYTHLNDASRVLSQLQNTYPANTLELLPLALGAVLKEGGLLGAADGAGERAQVMLVASPEEVRTARRLADRLSSAPRPASKPARKSGLQGIPVFHLGQVPWRDAPEGEEEMRWPFFFRSADVDALWKEIGQGAERPPLLVTDLTVLIAALRDEDAAPARPIVCPPLDAIEYLRERDRGATRTLDASAVSEVDAAAVEEEADGNDQWG